MANLVVRRGSMLQFTRIGFQWMASTNRLLLEHVLRDVDAIVEVTEISDTDNYVELTLRGTPLAVRMPRAFVETSGVFMPYIDDAPTVKAAVPSPLPSQQHSTCPAPPQQPPANQDGDSVALNVAMAVLYQFNNLMANAASAADAYREWTFTDILSTKQQALYDSAIDRVACFIKKE